MQSVGRITCAAARVGEKWHVPSLTGMRFPIIRLVLPLALLAALTGCGREKDEKARNAIHDAGFAYSVNDFLRAAREGNEGVMREFLKAGMNPDVADERGVTAIASAAAGGQGHVVDLLLAHGAKPNAATPEGQTALMAAAQSGDEQAVKALLAAGADAQVKDGGGLSPLAVAVLAGHAAVVMLLAEGASGSLDHALQLAAVKGHTPVMAVLMDRGASPLAVSVDGRTPMMFAAQYGHTEAVKLLRQRGASVTALDENLKTAANHAEENGHEEVAAYLREPDRSADPLPAESPALRLPDVPWNGDAPASLEAVAAAMQMVAYRSRTLPIVVEEVPEGDEFATIRVLTGEEHRVTAAPGEEIPGTGLTVEKVRRRFISSKHGQGRLVDASEVFVTDNATGQRHLAVKGLPASAGEGCATVKLGASDELIEVRRGDTFTAGAIPVKVVDVRPVQIVLERTDTKETVTVKLEGVKKAE